MWSHKSSTIVSTISHMIFIFTVFDSFTLSVVLLICFICSFFLLVHDKETVRSDGNFFTLTVASEIKFIEKNIQGRYFHHYTYHPETLSLFKRLYVFRVFLITTSGIFFSPLIVSFTKKLFDHKSYVNM